jgi:hypothetical protein
VKDIPIVKVQVTLESFEKILVMGQLKVSFWPLKKYGEWKVF